MNLRISSLFGAAVAVLSLAGAAPASPAAGSTPSPEGLSTNVVTDTFRANLPELQRCYLIASQKNKSIRVRVEVAFEIAPDGTVETAKVAKTDHADGLFTSCLVDAIRSWKFQAPAGGVSLKVTYPLLFSPGSTVTMANDVPPTAPKHKRKAKKTED